MKINISIDSSIGFFLAFACLRILRWEDHKLFMFRLSIISVLYIGNNTKYRKFRANIIATADFHVYRPNILYSLCQSTMQKFDGHFLNVAPRRTWRVFQRARNRGGEPGTSPSTGQWTAIRPVRRSSVASLTFCAVFGCPGGFRPNLFSSVWKNLTAQTRAWEWSLLGPCRLSCIPYHHRFQRQPVLNLGVSSKSDSRDCCYA